MTGCVEQSTACAVVQVVRKVCGDFSLETNQACLRRYALKDHVKATVLQTVKKLCRLLILKGETFWLINFDLPSLLLTA